MYDIGIVVAAQGVPEDDIKKFNGALATHKTKCSYIVEMVQDSPQPNELFSKPIAINQGLKKLLPQCKVVVQTDIDILIPPGAIDYTYDLISKSKFKHILWIKSRTLNKFEDSYPWDKWTKLGIRERMSGCWLAMKVGDWWHLGGYNEDIWGWGSDDWELTTKATKRGYTHECAYHLPLMHINHEQRPYWTDKTTRANDKIRGKSLPACNWIAKSDPEFLVIGAQKSGTTSFIKQMEQHPEIYVPSAPVWTSKEGTHQTNEIHFFNKEEKFKRGLDWYRQFFVKHPDLHKFSGEKTPEYFHMTSCHKRLKINLPNVKLFLLLRDPVTRTISAMNHVHQEDGQQWALPKLKHLGLNASILKIIEEHPKHKVLQFSYYPRCLESLYSYFPKEQVHVIIAEEYKENIAGTMNEAYKWLGAKCLGTETVWHVRKYREEVEQTTIDILREHFKETVKRTEEILGRSLPW